MVSRNKKQASSTSRWIDESFHLPEVEIRYIIDKAIELSEHELPFEQYYEKRGVHRVPRNTTIDMNEDPWDRIRKLTRSV